MPKFIAEIHIAQGAPPKPPFGAPCNGCGACCLLEPCPLGVLLYGRRQGECQALRWCATTLQYRCGVIISPHEVLQDRLPRGWHFLLPGLTRVSDRWARRWVAAGTGCDCDVQVDEET